MKPKPFRQGFEKIYEKKTYRNFVRVCCRREVDGECHRTAQRAAFMLVASVEAPKHFGTSHLLRSRHFFHRSLQGRFRNLSVISQGRQFDVTNPEWIEDKGHESIHKNWQQLLLLIESRREIVRMMQRFLLVHMLTINKTSSKPHCIKNID